jgi:hypothetical protein
MAEAAIVAGGVDTGASTSTGGMVRLVPALVTVRSDQGEWNILAAMTKGGGPIASIGAGGGKGG